MVEEVVVDLPSHPSEWKETIGLHFALMVQHLEYTPAVIDLVLGSLPRHLRPIAAAEAAADHAMGQVIAATNREVDLVDRLDQLLLES